MRNLKNCIGASVTKHGRFRLQFLKAWARFGKPATDRWSPAAGCRRPPPLVRCSTAQSHPPNDMIRDFSCVRLIRPAPRALSLGARGALPSGFLPVSFSLPAWPCSSAWSVKVSIPLLAMIRRGMHCCRFSLIAYRFTWVEWSPDFYKSDPKS